MPGYQLHRLKEAPRQQYRWAPHTSGLTTVKQKDYEPAEVVEADSPYAVWEKLRRTDSPLQVGDILAIEGGRLRICKYIGFEEAQWFVPESHEMRVEAPVEASIEVR
jgi:hypothetical protein